MPVFFIFYGLIEALNSIYVYKKKNKYDLFVTSIWGFSFILVGLVEIFKFSQPWNVLAYAFFGITWLPMMFTPCGIPIFRINKKTMFARKIIFLLIGLSQFIFMNL